MGTHFYHQSHAAPSTSSVPQPLLERQHTRAADHGEISSVDAVPPIAHDVLQSPGQPLDAATRRELEPRFGHDFSRVRLHTDAQAAQSARAVDALAYTVGPHIAFAAGQYQPASSAGQRLLAHELTHVVQQSAQPFTTATTLHIGATDSPQEREAAALAATVDRAGGAAHDDPVHVSAHMGHAMIQRFPGGKDSSLADLETYLALLQTSGDIERAADSDDKARALIQRRAELGPFSTEVQILLVRELISGNATSADERAMLDLLRDASTADRTEIVTQIGRDTLWANFGGGNRRAIEALTLTDSDFADAGLTQRLRRLSRAALQDYIDNALDPAVRSKLEHLQRLRKITTPVDFSATSDASGAASMVVNGIEVTFLPDQRSSDEKMRTRAHTEIELEPGQVTDVVSTGEYELISFTPPTIRAAIQTTYGPMVRTGGKSTYGRGTTVADRGSGDTSLRFHEGQHGLAFIEFLRNNPPPQFTATPGQPMREFHKAEDDYEQAIKDYSERIRRFSIEQTDCPGTPISPDELTDIGMSATICTDLSKTER